MKVLYRHERTSSRSERGFPVASERDTPDLGAEMARRQAATVDSRIGYSIAEAATCRRCGDPIIGPAQPCAVFASDGSLVKCAA